MPGRWSKYKGPNVVFFHMSTAGFGRYANPVEIAAIDSWGDQRWKFSFMRQQIVTRAYLFIFFLYH